MQEEFQSRTDLALEINEQIAQKDKQDQGIKISEWIHEPTDIKVSVLEIINEKGERLFKKPKGKYITIEAREIHVYDELYEEAASEIIAQQLEELIHENTSKKSKLSILVAGLGNKEVTADALGPLVVENISVDRHMGLQSSGIWLSGITPGVMAQTGMETAQIIKGIVKESAPDLVIAIDALAARNSSRLNNTVQISDRGIHPGSGVGNHRQAINFEALGVPVIAIGVPTVISAPTIVNDTMENLLKALAASQKLKGVDAVYESYTAAEKYALVKELIVPEMADMYVTPKDVDASVRTISYVIAAAINRACKKM